MTVKSHISKNTPANHLNQFYTTWYDIKDKNFDGMLQQEFFAVDEGYRGMGLGTELRAQIAKLGITTFTVVDADDRETMVGMINNGYEMVAVVPDDGSGHPVQIWVG